MFFSNKKGLFIDLLSLNFLILNKKYSKKVLNYGRIYSGFLTVYLKIIIDIGANIDNSSLKTGRIRML
jgi:hypothetical protein